MVITIKLLKTWREHDVGTLLEIEQDVGDLLVETDVAEVVKSATADPPKAEPKVVGAAPDDKNDKAFDAGAVKAIVAEAVKTAVGEALKEVDKANKGPMTVKVVREGITEDPKRGFKSHREFLDQVMLAGKGQPESHWSDSLKFVHAARGEPGIKAAGSDEQSAFADPYGGFLIPEYWAPDFLRLEPEIDPMAGRTRMVPMQGPVAVFRARVDKNHSSSVSGGLRVYRRAEADTSATSRMEVEQVKLAAYSLFGVAYATEEILTDSPISFTGLLSQSFNDEFTSKMIDERLNGAGVGEYEGIANTPAKIGISKETGQPADTIVWKNILKMRERCWRYSTAIWLYNHDCLTQLMTMTLPIGTAGVAMWHTSGTEDRPDMFLGRPAFATEYCKTVGDTGDIVLANWSEYLEGVLQPLQGAESIHVRFTQAERCFRFWMRNAGCPWWRSALTPKNSSDTLSPFVYLNERA